MSSSGRGQALIPWPNRLQDGSYEFDGRHNQLPLNEPEHRNAIHGLVRWAAWTASKGGTESPHLAPIHKAEQAFEAYKRAYLDDLSDVATQDSERVRLDAICSPLLVEARDVHASRTIRRWSRPRASRIGP